MKTENPQAFPDPMRGAEQTIYNQTPHDLSEGMTLRDYFAAKALSIIPTIANSFYQNIETWEANDYARESYKIADAMLKAREI
tara:strand:+ start:6963 stop:7211 length:249 start_codon:yes stop_codon:yes gene_type:complete